MIWTDKHNQAIEKTFEGLRDALRGCESRIGCQKALNEKGWPHGPHNEFGSVSEVVQKVMANRAILERCRELMTQ